MVSEYRADVDGLRAVAVVLVVLGHLGLGPAGGFIGVDVFFVISGYLITGIVRGELRSSTFTFAAFYGRRARRILPALVAVCVFCLAAGWVLLLPTDLASLGRQVATALTGVSNFYFALKTGYFDPSAELMPLLHTWSLGVEEQFYLLWPLTLVLLHRRRRLSRTVLVWIGGIVFVASLVVAQLIVMRFPDAAFYLPFSRAWELALGAAITYMPRPSGRGSAHAASVAGLLLILGSALLFSDATVFPGISATVPCAGAALILWPARAGGIGNRLLALPPFVWVGRISYSLYLWHWPLLVFARHYLNGESVPAQFAVVVLVASFAVAALSWRFIEQPFRQRRVGWQAPAIALGVVFLAGLALSQQAGFPGRLSETARHIASFRYSWQPSKVPGACDLTRPKSCPAPSAGQKSVLLLGDSHAAHFVAAFVEAFPAVAVNYWTRSRCRPVLRPEGRGLCVDDMRQAYGKLIPTRRYDAIILSARWRNGQSDQIAESVAYLKRYTDRVIVFGQTIEYPGALPELLLQGEILRAPVDLSREPPSAPELRLLNDRIEQAARSAGGEYFDPLDAICSKGACQLTTADGTPLQSDYGHLTRKGAALVLDRFRAQGLSF